MTQFVSAVEPSLVTQTLNYASVETSIVTRRLRIVVVPPSRIRLVCIEFDGSLEIAVVERLVEVVSERTVEVPAVSGRTVAMAGTGTRSVAIVAAARLVTIPEEEKCCE